MNIDSKQNAWGQDGLNNAFNTSQQVQRLPTCATCNHEIFPPNSLRGYGNNKQYCSCVRAQRQG